MHLSYVIEIIILVFALAVCLHAIREIRARLDFNRRLNSGTWVWLDRYQAMDEESTP